MARPDDIRRDPVLSIIFASLPRYKLEEAITSVSKPVWQEPYSRNEEIFIFSFSAFCFLPSVFCLFYDNNPMIFLPFLLWNLPLVRSLTFIFWTQAYFRLLRLVLAS
jgi:hypothetical protein